jgi:hypothetical protein
MRPTGFEPATFGLKDRRSLGPRKDPLTTELRALLWNDTRATGFERSRRGKMSDSTAKCDWGRAWPSRSRTQGAAFAGGKGKTEDAELRSARRVTQACLVVESLI